MTPVSPRLGFVRLRIFVLKLCRQEPLTRPAPHRCKNKRLHDANRVDLPNNHSLVASVCVLHRVLVKPSQLRRADRQTRSFGLLRDFVRHAAQEQSCKVAQSTATLSSLPSRRVMDGRSMPRCAPSRDLRKRRSKAMRCARSHLACAY